MSTLPVLIENSEEVEILGFNGGISDSVLGARSKIVEVHTDVVKVGIERILMSMSELVEGLKFSNSDYQIEELKINLNVGANGEVSILSVTGDTNISSSITVTIKKK